MLRFVSLCFGTVVRLFRARRSLLIENLALRQQLAAIKRRHPRSQLGRLDKLFWVVIRQFWSRWKKALIVVTPETVVRWHEAGFRLYWRLISKVKKPIGRRQTPKQVRQLIFRMVAENTTWGAPRLHGELLMLGFDISERTISRWMKQAPRDSDPAKRWRAFLKNHREAIAAMDFFTVPTITFGVLTASSSSVMIGRASCTLTNILGEQSLQMAFIQRNNVVQQVSSTASHPPLRDAILPWTSE
jgi:putative transposase